MQIYAVNAVYFLNFGEKSSKRKTKFKNDFNNFPEKKTLIAFVFQNKQFLF